MRTENLNSFHGCPWIIQFQIYWFFIIFLKTTEKTFWKCITDIKIVMVAIGGIGQGLCTSRGFAMFAATTDAYVLDNRNSYIF